MSLETFPIALPSPWRQGPDVPEVAVVVRTHRISRVEMLKRAIFSLCTQQAVRVELCVATQNFAKADIDTVLAELAPLLAGAGAIGRASLVNVSGPPGADLRAALLNAGIASTTARYLAFLDDDDVVYSDLYRRLIADLAAARAHIAFGRCVRVFGEERGGVFYASQKSNPYTGASLIELINDNFAPIHSYLVDREAIDAADLYFDDMSPYLEDYRFLLRLAAKYKSTFLSMNRDLCEYWIYSSKINTTERLANPFSPASDEWRRAQEETERLKAELRLDVSFLDVALWCRTQARRMLHDQAARGYDSLLPTDTAIMAGHTNADRLRLAGDAFVDRGEAA